MDDFINQLAISANLERADARLVTQSFLRMADRHLSGPLAADLFQALPGARGLLDENSVALEAEKPASGIEAMMSGAMKNAFGHEDPLITVLNDAKAAGLTYGQTLIAGQAFLDFARQKAGATVLQRITNEIPGLSRIN